MPKLLFVRRHPWVSLAAALALLLLIIGFFWYQSSLVPRYPGAHNLTHERAEPSERFRACGRTGEENQSGIQITRFVTSDSPDVVLQFYAAALVDRGTYALIAREHMQVFRYGMDGRIADDVERATFAYETPNTPTQYAYHLATGYRVMIDAAPKADRTTVQITEYHYQRFARACHP